MQEIISVPKWQRPKKWNRTVGKVRSGMGAYAAAARRRILLATVHPRPPGRHSPNRRKARHAHTPQIGLHLSQPQNGRPPAWSSPSDLDKTGLMGGVLRRLSRHMPVEAYLALPNYMPACGQPLNGGHLTNAFAYTVKLFLRVGSRTTNYHAAWSSIGLMRNG